MKLLVDIGNSRCKAALERDGELEPLHTFVWRNVLLNASLEKAWLKPLDGIVPDSVHVSNVAGDHVLRNLNAWCSRHWRKRPIAMAAAERFNGLINGYDVPERLGADRWAAMIGARDVCSGALCVVDAGTATTVDVIRADGRHIGGAILPGIFTMRRSLARYTAALVAAEGRVTPFSTNTANGIAGGTGHAAVGAIERLVGDAGRRVGKLTTIITGGDAPILQALLGIEHIHDPLLVLRGIEAQASAQCDQARVAESSCKVANPDWLSAMRTGSRAWRDMAGIL